MQRLQQRGLAGRARPLFWLVTLMVAGLLVRLATLQALAPPAAGGPAVRVLPLAARRGDILDRNGRLMATSRAAHSVAVTYPHWNDPALRRRLSEMLGIPLPVIEAGVAERNRQWRFAEPLELKADASPALLTRIAEQGPDLPGVVVIPEPLRSYPLGRLAAHALGYVGSAGAGAPAAPAGHASGDSVGLVGLERSYEDHLRGQAGQRRLEVDAMQRPLPGAPAVYQPPEPGHSLVLTIDTGLQEVAERTLDWTLWRLRHSSTERGGPFPRARSGAVVVLDVRTGEVLALVSRPAFDPGTLVTGDAAALRQLFADQGAPLFNRAIAGAYPPGSTFKMVTAAAALAGGHVTPAEQLFCPGYYDRVQPAKLDWLAGGHGWVDLERALGESVNTYFYEMGYRAGVDALVTWGRALGLGVRTGIDLAGEAAGTLPDERFREQRAARGDPWQVGDTLSAAIGQAGVSVTPLQLAGYTAALAAGGQSRRPYLVQAIRHADGATVATFGPQPPRPVGLDPAAVAAIIEGMVWAHQHPQGTGYRTFGGFAVPTAGKTGTAEVPGSDHLGVYVAFAPVAAPEIAVAVVAEEAGSGSALAPVVKAVFAARFGITLDEGDPARAPAALPPDA